MNTILYLTILPEIFLTIITMFLLMVGVFNKGENSYNLVSNFSIAGLLITLLFILSGVIRKVPHLETRLFQTIFRFI